MGRPSDHPASSPGGGGWIDGATIQPSPPGEKAWNEIRSGFDRRPFMLDLLIVTRWTNYSKKGSLFIETRSGFDRRPFMLDLPIVTRWIN